MLINAVVLLCASGGNSDTCLFSDIISSALVMGGAIVLQRTQWNIQWTSVNTNLKGRAFLVHNIKGSQ